MTENSKKNSMELASVSIILFILKKKEIEVLINSGSEVNTMTPAYASKLE